MKFFIALHPIFKRRYILKCQDSLSSSPLFSMSNLSKSLMQAMKEKFKNWPNQILLTYQTIAVVIQVCTMRHWRVKKVRQSLAFLPNLISFFFHKLITKVTKSSQNYWSMLVPMLIVKLSMAKHRYKKPPRRTVQILYIYWFGMERMWMLYTIRRIELHYISHHAMALIKLSKH